MISTMLKSSFNTRLAASILHDGGVVAYPTEAVWGLGCDPDNAEAVAQILRMKERDPNKGLILVAASIEQFDDYLQGLPAQYMARLVDSWPGPVTWLVPDNGTAPDWIKGRFPSVALRVSAHTLVQDLCNAVGGPIVSTSANRSGRPALTRHWQVRRAFADAVDYCLHGPLGGADKPSEIRDLVTGQIVRAS